MRCSVFVSDDLNTGFVSGVKGKIKEPRLAWESCKGPAATEAFLGAAEAPARDGL